MFRILQLQARREIKTRIKNSVPSYELHAINATQNEAELHWHQEGKEFRLNGKMYDVVHVETKDGQTIYHCVDDVDEARLFAHLDDMVNENMDHDQSARGKTARNLLKHFSQVYITPQFIFPVQIIANYQVTYIPHFENALGHIPEKLTPPPQRFS
ncbi:MAG: hypothetical protein ACXWEY_09150 [Bacteroidia bacterium]